MSEPSLREAYLHDADTLAAIIQDAFEEYRHVLVPPTGAHQETPDNIRGKLSHARAILAFLHGQPAGCVFYEPAEDHVYLGRLAVRPAFRRQGIGGALVRAVESRAAALGIPRVRLGARIALPRNQELYRRLGYEVVGVGHHTGYAEPTFVWMEKRL